MLEAAQVIADQFDIEMRPIVVTARAAGRAIVEEATNAALRSHHPRHAAQTAHRRSRVRRHR